MHPVVFRNDYDKLVWRRVGVFWWWGLRTHDMDFFKAISNNYRLLMAATNKITNKLTSVFFQNKLIIFSVCKEG